MSYDMRQRDDADARYDAETHDHLDTPDPDREDLEREHLDRDDLDRDDRDRDDPGSTDLERDPDGLEPHEAEVQEADVHEAEVREDQAAGMRGDVDRYPDAEDAEPFRDPDTGTYRSAAAEPAETQTGVAPVGDTTEVGEPDIETPLGATPSAMTPSAMTPSIESLWPDGETSGFQDRWREVQLRFVDDPRGAADEAEALADEVINQFTAAVTARKRELDSWRDNADGADTERMRMAVRQYRQLLDRVFGA